MFASMFEKVDNNKAQGVIPEPVAHLKSDANALGCTAFYTVFKEPNSHITAIGNCVKAPPQEEEEGQKMVQLVESREC